MWTGDSGVSDLGGFDNAKTAFGDKQNIGDFQLSTRFTNISWSIPTISIININVVIYRIFLLIIKKF